eukprot:jgi/Mesvir1/18963/Mv18930-RA.1
MASFGAAKREVYDKESRREYYRAHLQGLNAFDRHKKFLSDYALFYGGESGPSSDPPFPLKTDEDVLREHHRFLRSDEDDAGTSWEQRLAKRYYDKLFKEYCLADMSRYKEFKIGMRWRTEKEVVAGKGQFICGNKACSNTAGLHSFEVNFAYKEAGEVKNALVKLRLCPECGYKLNYKKELERERGEAEVEKQQKKEMKMERKRRRFEEERAQLEQLKQSYDVLHAAAEEPRKRGSRRDGSDGDVSRSRCETAAASSGAAGVVASVGADDAGEMDDSLFAGLFL